MAGYIGNKAVGINVTTGDILGDVGVGGNIDVDGISNLDVVDIDGAVNMATTLETSGTVTVKHTDGVANVSLSPTSTGGVINVRNSSGVGVITLDGRNGLATIGNKLILTDGNLVVAAGHGIDFAAQTASSASGTGNLLELLDHYEEGTWTPVLTPSSSGSYGYAAQIGNYTRIGDVVTVTFWLAINALSSPSGNLILAGLPFTSSNNARATASLRFYSLVTDKIINNFTQNGNHINLQTYAGSGHGGVHANVTHTVFAASGDEIGGTLVYQVD